MFLISKAWALVKKVQPFLFRLGAKLVALGTIWSLTLFGSICYMYYVFPDQLTRINSHWWYWLSFIIFFGSVFLQQWSYFVLAWGDPGRVPLASTAEGGYQQVSSSEAATVGEPFSSIAVAHEHRQRETNSDDDDVVDDRSSLYCRQCNARRPARAHHCSFCGRCVRRFDHHCPTVGNCIGEDNHKHFVLFLFYSIVMALFFFITFLYYAPSFLGPRSNGASILDAACIISLVLLFSQPFFVGFHIYLLLRDFTTIEYMVYTGRYGCCKSMDTPLFSAESLYNFKRIFGDSPLIWWLPIKSPSQNPFSCICV